MDRSKQLGEEKIGSLLIKFSVPAIIGMIVNALYNIIDRIFVGRGVGPLAISGIAIVFPIMAVIMAFGMLVSIGATAMISIRLGEKKRDEAELILGNAFILLIVIAVVITSIGFIFMDPLITLFGASQEVFKYAKDYITVILYGTVFQTLSFGLNNLVRADANPKIAMLTMIIGAIINAILNPIFIFGFHFGIRGSALATVISQMITTVWVMSYFFGKRSMLKIRRKNLNLRKSIVLSVFSIGISPFAMQIAASVVTVLFNKSLKTYGGDIAIAAMGIINAISMLILMPIFGINQGAQPIIGYNYGARSFGRVKETLKLAILAATSICITGFIIIEIFAVKIMRVFSGADVSLVNIGSHGIRIVLMMLPIIGFQIVSSNYFQAVGKPKHAMFLSLSRQVIILIPLILILPGILKLNGVWLASPIADFLSSVLTAVFLFNEIRGLNRRAES